MKVTGIKALFHLTVFSKENFKRRNFQQKIKRTQLLKGENPLFKIETIFSQITFFLFEGCENMRFLELFLDKTVCIV